MIYKCATPLFVLGLLLAGSTPGYSQTSKEAKEAESKGEAAMKSGDLDAAIKNFSEAIRLDPDYVAAYANRSFAYGNKGKSDAAIADLDEASRLDPKSTAACCRRGEALFDKHNLDEAIEEYSAAIRLDPECTSAYIDRAQAYGFKSECDKQMADAREAYRLDPKLPIVNNILGCAYDNCAKMILRANGEVGDRLFDRLSSHFDAPPRKLEDVSPLLPVAGSVEDFKAAAQKLDRIHKGQLLFDYSASYFKTAIEIRSDYAFGNNNLGVYYARSGPQHDAIRAEKLFRAAVKSNPRYADAFNNLGIVLAEQGRDLERQGRFDEALAKLADSVRQHVSGLSVRPDRASDHNNLCGALLEMGRVHKAAAEKARDPQAGAPHQTDKAERESELQAQDLDKALKEDEVALQCDPNFVGAWQSRIAILREQKKPDDAWECYVRIIEIDPTHDGVQALAALMAHYDEQKKPEKVAEYMEKAGECFLQHVKGKQASMEFVSMPFFLANAYLNLKQPDNAITWLDRTVECLDAATAGQPDAVSIRFKLAVLYLKLKRPDQAEKVVVWLNKLLAENGSLIDAYALREAAHEILGNTVAARADADHVARGTLQQRYGAARLYYDLDQPDKTIALLNPLLAANLPPGDAAELLMLRAAAYEMKGDFPVAKPDYERVKQISPQFPGVEERLKAIEEKLKAVNEKLQKPPK